jgi:hypothetical protein
MWYHQDSRRKATWMVLTAREKLFESALDLEPEQGASSF